MTDSLTDEEVRRLSGFIDFSKVKSREDLKKHLYGQFGNNNKLTDFLENKFINLVVTDNTRDKVYELALRKGYIMKDNDRITSTIIYGNNVYYVRDKYGRIKTSVIDRASKSDVKREMELVNSRIKQHEEELERLREKLRRMK